ncbi:hypothetical protein [Nocardioides ferulae]|uniref:hypothetical protein n=1 Tax=Nocardioides ferulae TaxID=2340821 RepID=UPI000EB29A94|nr:hypothetical protein [Nocardioides ferulae]
MSDPHDYPARDDSADGWLTPTAAAIAGFTLAVLTLFTNGAWVLAVQTLISRNGPSAYEDGVMATGAIQGVLAVGALVFARRGLASSAPAARHLGGAGVLLAALAILVAVLTVLAGMVAAD